ncbi:MAG TPA: glycosyltransferase family 2 protein [Candidatus Obscuribacterales bacterium]
MAVDLSVVVAVYNEHPRNLDHLLDRLQAALAPTALAYEVVFVNDGSRQPTSEALIRLANEYDYVKLLVLSRNFGQQAAISAGIEHADGDAIVNIDSDCQDPPELIPDMVRLWKEGYDVVYAQRSARKDKFGKKFCAFLFYRVLGAVSSVKIPWDTGDFRLMDRRVLDALLSMPEKSRFLRGQIPWLGFKQVGIPIERGAREIGESTYTLRKLINLAMDGLLGFSVAPLYLVPMFGGAMLAVGTVALVIAVLAVTAFKIHVSTPIWVGSMLAMFAGIQTILFGIVAVYLSKVLDEVRARPTYIVQDRIGLPFARSSERERGLAPAATIRVK